MKYDTDKEIGQTDPEDMVKAEIIESSDAEMIEQDPKFQEVKEEVINCGNQVVQQENLEKNENKNVSLGSKIESKAEEIIDELDQNSDDEEMFDESYFVQI